MNMAPLLLAMWIDSMKGIYTSAPWNTPVWLAIQITLNTPSPRTPTCVACHPNMTFNRDVSENHIPARLARSPRERAVGGSLKPLVLLAFQKLNPNEGFKAAKKWLFSQACPRFIKVSFGR